MKNDSYFEFLSVSFIRLLGKYYNIFYDINSSHLEYKNVYIIMFMNI